MRRRAGFTILLGLAALACAVFAPPAFAGDGAAYCADGRHQVASAVPAALQPNVAKAFGISVEMARDAATVRCVGGKLMACWVGANLDCGRANVHRSLLGANAYCREHPGSDSIPMVATGHDTIYDWRCDGRRAVAGKANRAVDASGYIAENWREAQ
ncbi:MAG TPA: hypothetical protein VGH40_19500 [Roseiarcus sp.]|jgi:hypothetical protein